jgi:hypothetical protein
MDVVITVEKCAHQTLAFVFVFAKLVLASNFFCYLKVAKTTNYFYYVMSVARATLL